MDILPPEVKYLIMDYVYGEPKDLMYRVRHNIKWMRVVGQLNCMLGLNYRKWWQVEEDEHFWPMGATDSFFPSDIFWNGPGEGDAMDDPQTGEDQTLYQMPRWMDTCCGDDYYKRPLRRVYEGNTTLRPHYKWFLQDMYERMYSREKFESLYQTDASAVFFG